MVIDSSCRTSSILFILATGCLVATGCVSSSMFDEFKYETRRDLSSLLDEQGKLESDMASLRSDIRRIGESQEALNSEVHDWLSKSERKLKEMEDRVIEIRLELREIRLMLRRAEPVPR